MSEHKVPSNRKEIIAGRLARGESVSSSDLSLEFAVSEDAIRRDLRALASEGRCKRVYGGALPISPASTSMAERIDENHSEKAVLARSALHTIAENEFIFLDNGSTNLALAQRLTDQLSLTVATNSIAIANVLIANPAVQLILIGGGASHQVGGCVDNTAIQQLATMTFDRAFIGACAVDGETGLNAFDMQDAVFKRQLVTQARVSTVMATHDKLFTSARFNIVELQQIDQLIVSDQLTKQAQTRLMQYTDVLLATAT